MNGIHIYIRYRFNLLSAKSGARLAHIGAAERRATIGTYTWQRLLNDASVLLASEYKLEDKPSGFP